MSFWFGIAPVEIQERIEEAFTTTVPLTPIASDVEKLLGPGKSTTEVLEELDHEYREQIKLEIWYLLLTEPVSPNLDEFPGPAPAIEVD